VKVERKTYIEMSDNEGIHWWFVARRMILKRVLDRFAGQSTHQHILEAGCGSGGNLEMLTAYGDLEAMELDEESRTKANLRKLCLVKKGRLPDNLPYEQEFDLICMLDVLEHIEDDSAALRAIKARLTRNGLFLITVPAYKFLWSCHDTANHHKRRYTKKQLVDLLTRAGFEIKYSTYFNTFLFPIIALTRFINNLFGRDGQSDVDLPSGFVNSLLTKIFSAERYFIPGLTLPFGVSILIAAGRTEDSGGY